MYLNVLKRKVLILKFINESNLTGKYIGIKESNCVLLCCQLLSLFFHDLFLIKSIRYGLTFNITNESLGVR